MIIVPSSAAIHQEGNRFKGQAKPASLWWPGVFPSLAQSPEQLYPFKQSAWEMKHIGYTSDL